MSGMLRLDEKHKRCVELILRATPRDEIAEELGVSRSTVFAWMNDPLVQAYYEKLVSELKIARQQRLLPTFLKAVALFEAGLEQALTQLSSTDPAERLAAPGLQTLASVLKTVHQLERVDTGNPSQISETRTPADTAPKKRSVLEQLLDAVVLEGEQVIELEPVEPKS